MKRSLAVWCETQRVGTLTADEGVWEFGYHIDWIASATAFALSPHFPLRSEPFSDFPDDRRVQWFFDNLLPEGGVRQALASFANLNENDGFGLLARYGEESAGALTLLPDDGTEPRTAGYEPLAPEALRGLVRNLPKVPFIAAEGRARMSLAGAQHKLPLHRDGDAWLLPQGGPSSWILKPDNVNNEYQYCPANEHFCSRLADASGVVVPRSELFHLPEAVFAVERYDRVIEHDKVRRLHQVDLCQLLNRWAGSKYESDGGIDLVAAYRALEHTRQPAPSRNQFLRWFVFNYLIGNSDAHAKNIAFIVGPGRIDLAPAYDLVSVRAYGEDYDYMAMSVGSENRYGWIEKLQWDGLATALKLPKTFLARILDEMATTVPREARALVSSAEFLEDEREFLAECVAVIETHAGYVNEALS